MPRTVLHYTAAALPPTATAQQKGAFVGGDGRVHFFTKKEVARAAATWSDILRPAREAFGPPLAGPVLLTVDLTWPFTKSTPKRVVNLGYPVPHAARPDMDNLVKSLLDVMTTLQFWTDDGQVSTLQARKWRGPAGRVEIALAVPDDSPTLAGRAPVELDMTSPEDALRLQF